MRPKSLSLLAFSAFLALAGCGGGSDGGNIVAPPPPSACSAASCGTALVSFTDADGDFLSYTVDVVSLSLTRANGAVVEALPTRTRVDFAQLVDVTELVTAATVPNGRYVAGTIRLDYSDADIVVDVGGQARPAVVVDANGAPVTQLDLEIRLDERRAFVIAPGRPALLQLDFDLAASNDLDLGTDPVRVTPRPFIVADVDRVDEREMVVRGPLVEVDTAADSYVVDVRPFLLRDVRFGEVTVHVTDATTYEIDGEAFTGEAGLAALAALPAGSPTAAFGTLDVDSGTYTAKRVHAGTSVEGPRFDVARGHVVARSGDTLTLRGVTLARRDGSVRFVRGDVQLLVGGDTLVTKDGAGVVPLGAQAISVGQRLHAFGEVSEAGDAVTLDATDGRVRLHLTRLFGLVKDSQPGSLRLDLEAIDGHRPSIFDFTGTGSSPAQDADPADYEVATGALPLHQLLVDTPVQVLGFVSPFGAAPPDFEGRTVVDFANVRAHLVMGYLPGGSTSPFTSIEPTGIVFDMGDDALGARHHVAYGPRLIDVLGLPVPVRLLPAAAGTYAIGDGRAVDVYAGFDDFAAALAETLDGSRRVLAVHASGRFDANAGELTADRALVVLLPE